MTDDDSDTDGLDRGGRREVIVPDRVYKTVTVFSTLVAVGGVVVGFVLIDEATGRATRQLSEIDVPLALLGLGFIVFCSVQYAYAQRFQAEGMTTDKTSEDTPADNG